MEEVARSFAEFVAELDTMIDGCVEVAQGTITDEAQKLRTRILQNLDTQHTNTGALAGSFRMTKASGRGSYFGYRFGFDGYDGKGRPFQVIANSLDRGSVRGVSPSYFFSNAIPPLTGLSGRIMDNVDEYIAGQDT